jgi:outer membrane protein
MTRFSTAAVAALLAGGVMFANVNAQTAGQTTPPPTTQKPTTPPAPQTPAPKPALPTVAAPPAKPFPADAKFAYIQMQAVISESKFGRCGSAILGDMRKKDQATLQTKQAEINAQQQKMAAQQGVVSESVITQMQRDLDRMNRDAQALAQQLETDETNKNQDLLNDFQSKILPLLESLRKEKELIFILSADMGGAIIAADTAYDLTAELIKRADVAIPDCNKGK